MGLCSSYCTLRNSIQDKSEVKQWGIRLDYFDQSEDLASTTSNQDEHGYFDGFGKSNGCIELNAYSSIERPIREIGDDAMRAGDETGAEFEIVIRTRESSRLWRCVCAVFGCWLQRTHSLLWSRFRACKNDSVTCSLCPPSTSRVIVLAGSEPKTKQPCKNGRRPWKP